MYLKPAGVVAAEKVKAKVLPECSLFQRAVARLNASDN